MELSPIYHSIPPNGLLLPQEEEAFHTLKKLNIEYERVSGEPADTMEKCKEISNALNAAVCKNLFLCNRKRTQYYLLCISSDKVFHTKDLSQQIGATRLSFGSEEALWELLHCTPGSASILGLSNDTDLMVRLLMDREVYEADYICCHPCICTSTLKIKKADLNKFLRHCRHDVTIVDL